MREKVLHITTVDVTLEEVIIDKMKELKKYGYDIELMSDIKYVEAGGSVHINLIKQAGFTHHLIPINEAISPWKDIKSMLKIKRFLENHPYDIVHTHTAKAGVIGRIAARLAKQPVIVHTSHGLPFYEGQSKVKNLFYKLAEKFSSYFSDGYFSQNKEDLKKIESFVPKRVITGYEGNGIDLSKLDAFGRITKEQVENNKQELGIDQEDFIFLMGARFEPVKNHYMLLKSLTQIANNHVKVLLAGQGSLEKEIKQFAERERLTDKVVFLGYRKDLLRFMQIADAIILTSEKEGVPRILMEAMACKKPVLATDVLGTNELVVHHKTGELVELNDHYKLAEIMDKWSSKTYTETLKQYGHHGRKRIEEHFTEQVVAKRIHHFYQQIMAEKFAKKHMNKKVL
ncbi:glycosyltransferase family 4 protein [Pseudogracilibacillus auburnensis]|uniref:Glycosyltransferase involved in cell wall biosynthesis n=1 Tax=Pseudogracilibacillus auburnensis TaxID=1494959 RepID=A0A2V3VI39_9BACI|nr:glycosyltransferase family 4 protein [Pseudogracilibacillus auburnensis]MBO1005303.1 glycosyltransferase family 4 protein [Pseudogracilibacillus auburnensis]PXW80498.1 glycosyltransferase involved in cell wall biosynthesis [Pseudogracilibacillus auburnensis]